MSQFSVAKITFILRIALCIASFHLVIATSAQDRPRVAHVFVALADNRHQGIVPVPPRLGNGQDSANNLYWGAAFGVKTFFKKRAEWKLLSCGPGPKAIILERCIFEDRNHAAFMVADAYDGAHIRETVTDLLNAAAGMSPATVTYGAGEQKKSFAAGSDADLVAYVGHDAFMDFQIPAVAGRKERHSQRFIILACASRVYFRPYMKETGSEPLLWTTGLMAPEAYTLAVALEGWLAGEGPDAIQQRAAEAYSKYQKCGLRAAQKLFVSGW